MADLPLAIVTGGAHRLGRAFAIDLARGGFAVLVHYHRSAEGAAETVALVEQSGVPAFSAQADLTQDRGIDLLFKQVDHLLETPESNLSHLAVLVNSAAMMLRGDVQSLTVEEWESTLNLNLQAPLLCAQKAAKRMKPGGLIVNVSDVGAEKAWSRFPAYVPSKAALNSLTKVMARSLAPSIRVNAIAPGLVLPSDNVTKVEWDRLVARLPLKRPAKIEEVVYALEFLIKNEYITGQIITVDGGYSLI